MKKLLLSTLLLTSLLVACGTTPNPATDDQNPTSTIVTTSEDPLPSAPGESIPADSTPGTGQTGVITIDAAMPTGWTYITNNPQYPDVAFYSDGGLKLNFANQAIVSPVFASAITSITVAGVTNANTKTGTVPATLAVYKVSGTTETEVGSIAFSAAEPYSKSFTIAGGATQIKIKLVSNAGFNVNLKTITLG